MDNKNANECNIGEKLMEPKKMDKHYETRGGGPNQFLQWYSDNDCLVSWFSFSRIMGQNEREIRYGPRSICCHIVCQPLGGRVCNEYESPTIDWRSSCLRAENNKRGTRLEQNGARGCQSIPAFTDAGPEPIPWRKAAPDTKNILIQVLRLRLMNIHIWCKMMRFRV